MPDDREAFLRAIFDAPDDDLPRLVYADWLEEHDRPAHAELIRLQCELARRPPGHEITQPQKARQAQLIRDVNRSDRPPDTAAFPNRGFRVCEELSLSLDELSDREAVRELAVTRRPEWFAATRFRLNAGQVQTAQHVADVLEPPFLERVRELDLSGGTTLVSFSGERYEPLLDVRTVEFRYESRITLPGLVALVQHPGVRRLTSLNLRNNDLDNDALRAVVRSPHLIRLKELDISQGNRFRGRVWQLLVERFGEEVVS